jgi:mRNA interferase MazF
MERGEVWWALIGEKCPVVLLSGAERAEFRAMQIVAPATAAQKRGFVVLPGHEAADSRSLRRAVGSAGPGSGIGGVGVQVEIGVPEGFPRAGVVRVALPREGRIFCTWMVTLTEGDLIERAGVLSSPKLDQLANALRLAGIE